MSRKPALFFLSSVVAIGFLTAASPVRAANETVVLNFNGNDQLPYDPTGGLVSDAAGNLYGATLGGGPHSAGTVFELTPGANGGWTGKTIHNFNGLDGEEPDTPLTFDSAGNLYGTTPNGGHSLGVVFQLSRGANGVWTEKSLHKFVGGIGGNYPQGPLTVDAAGNIYGTTLYGGTSKHCGDHGCGVVFQLSPGANGMWTETVLHNFEYGRVDGAYPVAGVTLDSAGNLYGTTPLGGSHLAGTLFQLSLINGTWTENILYNFCSQQPNCGDGQLPSATLIFDGSGNLYGTTQAGGISSGCNGAPCGTVFELSPGAGSTWTETVLYSFCSVANCADGAWPTPNSLVFDGSGNLYGTTATGGLQGATCSAYGCGTVFELTPGFGGLWSESVLYAFAPNGLDGSGQISGLVLDSASNLYGTTVGGGKYNEGVVFEVMR